MHIAHISRLAGAAFILWAAQIPALAQLSLNIGSLLITPGKPASVNISMNSSSGTLPSVVQWTLNYSSTNLAGMSLQPGSAAVSAGKTLSCASRTGSVSCVVWGINQNTVPNGVVATANFNVSPTASSSTTLQVTNAAAASAGTSLITATGSTATLTLLSSQVSKLACSPVAIVPPATATCTVTLSTPAALATSVSLGLASNSSTVTIPPSVTVPAGAASASFPVQAGLVAAPATAVLTASLNGASATFSLSLLPPLLVKTLSCAPTTVVTPGTSTCTVALSAAAATGGVTVALKLGTATTALTIPASVFVPAGATSANFTVNAQAVSLAVITSIVATLNGKSQTFPLTLTSPFGGGWALPRAVPDCRAASKALEDPVAGVPKKLALGVPRGYQFPGQEEPC